MRFPRILTRYLLREAVAYAALGLLGVGSILLTQNLLRQIGDVADVGFRLGDAGAILLCLTAMLAAYAVPIAFLFGALVAMGRLSADHEITAMRALGVSLTQLTAPFLALALVTSLGASLLVHRVEPAGRRNLRAVGADIAARGGLIDPGRFRRLDRDGQRLVFVEHRDADNAMEGVFLSDRSNPARPFTVVAERGRFSFDRETAMARIQLEAGDIHFESQPEELDRYRRISFGSFDYAWDMSELLGNTLAHFSVRELDSSTIREVLAHFDVSGEAPAWARTRQRIRYEIELQRRLALSAAPLVFALLAIPLGLRRSRGARSYGTLLCVLLVFGYYALLSFGIGLARDEELGPALALWLPNAVGLAAAGLLLWRARRAES